MSDNNIFPLVITNIKDVGNIKGDYINYAFYSKNIYTTTVEPPENVGTYKFKDEIILEDICGNLKYFYRIELVLSTGNINGLYFNNKGKIIKTKTTQTYLQVILLKVF